MIGKRGVYAPTIHASYPASWLILGMNVHNVMVKQMASSEFDCGRGFWEIRLILRVFWDIRFYGYFGMLDFKGMVSALCYNFVSIHFMSHCKISAARCLITTAFYLPD